MTSPPAPTEEPPTRRRRPRVGLIVLAVVLVLAAVAGLVHVLRDDTVGEIRVTASSTGAGYSAQDVVLAGAVGWRSADETVGAWLDLSWERPRVVEQVVLVRNALTEPGATAGFLTFSDGSQLQLRLSETSPETVVPLTPREIDGLRFTTTAVGEGARDVAIAQIAVHEGGSTDQQPGNVATAATVTTSDAGAADARALVDGSGTPGAAGVGAAWTLPEPDGAWVQLDWDRPRELTSVELVGSPGSRLRAATLVFGDGSSLPVGAVTTDPGRPTVVGFMPRVTSSVRLTLDDVDGPGMLALGEIRVFERGAAPVRAAAGTGPTEPPPSGACPGDAGVDRPAVVVTCPTAGSEVGASVPVTVDVGEGYTAVTAVAWPGDTESAAGPEARATPDEAGTATLTVELGDLPPGPVTVAITATGPAREAARVHLPLYREGGTATPTVPSDAPAAGRTLVFSEEFDRPVSLSRTGEGADYAAAKPVDGGAEDFGDAIFAEPGPGPSTVAVVDDSYLRMSVVPLPAGAADPAGWGRAHEGGMLASARSDGSGFSAQYGYFEARMLFSAAPGTWPAFWLLPSDNLVAPTPQVAEIDALEAYGHDSRAQCHSTHEHNADGSPDTAGVARCGPRFPTERDALSWHTYGVSVTPTEVVFFIDGRVVATAPQVRGGDAPMFFLADLALGGGWPVDLRAVRDRAVLYVDHIRVYV